MPIVHQGPKDVDSRTLTIGKSLTLSTTKMEVEDLYSQDGQLDWEGKLATMLARRKDLLNHKGKNLLKCSIFRS